MDGATWFMLAFYILGIGGVAVWTLVHSLHDKNGWNQEEIYESVGLLDGIYREVKMSEQTTTQNGQEREV